MLGFFKQFFKKQPVDLLIDPATAPSFRPITQAEMRAHVKAHISRGCTLLAAEIATIGGLEDEFPEVIAEAEAVGALMRGEATVATG